jgi:hypothetical protein
MSIISWNLLASIVYWDMHAHVSPLDEWFFGSTCRPGRFYNERGTSSTPFTVQKVLLLPKLLTSKSNVYQQATLTTSRCFRALEPYHAIERACEEFQLSILQLERPREKQSGTLGLHYKVD